MAHDPTRPPGEKDPAKARFMLISLIRLGGIAMILAAVAVAQGVLPLPGWTAWLLGALGVVEAFIVPQLLARIWSTNDRMPPNQ
ncbi:hypothetical protein [Alteraurantiacibacter aquimixticola]|uniref:Uncharacterized protein n=1 Tax=Alteraurantiacibacter aquimixticola TaxID=2489173 RepID=A0A4V4U9A8_9SPHN|nr:hypothetical protein [Alteraurantiacibacter aquimixticola]TIX51297.1 hypothetical protein E5222_02205 [Alteraurantiacibacter aquimixticola]